MLVSTRTDSVHAVAEVGQRIVDAFAEPFVISGRELTVSASVGIAVAETGLETPDELVRDADAAMYRAKERGGGRFDVFDSALRERLVERTSGTLSSAVSSSSTTSP